MTFGSSAEFRKKDDIWLRGLLLLLLLLLLPLLFWFVVLRTCDMLSLQVNHFVVLADNGKGGGAFFNNCKGCQDIGLWKFRCITSRQWDGCSFTFISLVWGRLSQIWVDCLKKRVEIDYWWTESADFGQKATIRLRFRWFPSCILCLWFSRIFSKFSDLKGLILPKSVHFGNLS